MSARQELNDLKRQIKKKENDYKKLRELSIRWEKEIKAWVSIAIEIGLLEENSRDIDFQNQLLLLQELVKNNTEEKMIKSDSIFKSSDEMIRLKENENYLAMELAKYKTRYFEMSQLMKNVSEYKESLSIQIERLRITEWLNEKAKKENVCPVCQQKCLNNEQRDIYLNRLNESERKMKQVEEIPASFEREYNDVKRQIRLLASELFAIQKQIKIEDNNIKRSCLKNESFPNRYTLDGVSRFLGKIEYASETLESLESDGELLTEIDKLKERINYLKTIINETTIKNKIENAIDKISFKQMELLKHMDAERLDDPFRLDYKNLTIQIDGKDGRKDYLWEIGSGSNWLAYHISTILGLQEFFTTFQSPVPNFVVFDQPSQVYFPHSSNDSDEQYNFSDLDREAAKSIFITMVKCMRDVYNNMQIIVLEHADSSIYGDIDGVNEICVWRDGKKLIPVEWID